MQTSETIGAIAAALAKAQSEMKNAPLNKVNPHFKSRYADLAAIRDAIIPALAKNGIAIIQATASDNGRIIVETRLIHSSGEWIGGSIPVMAPPTALAQAVGSALTYAKRYSLASLVCISADDDDDANAASEPVQTQQSRPVQVTKGMPKSPEIAAEAQTEPEEKPKVAFWKRPSLDLDPGNKKSPLQFADSFEKALAAAPDDKDINRLARDNDRHLDSLQEADRELCNALLEKMASRQAQGLAS
jgi:hypothetical protein